MVAMQIGKFKIDFQGKFHSYEYLKLLTTENANREN